MANKILLRRDTAHNWSNANPVLSNGEIGLETDTEKFKIGDGVSPWHERSYYANAQSIVTEYEGRLQLKVDEAEAQVALATASATAAAASDTAAGTKVAVAQSYATAADTYRAAAVVAKNEAEYQAQQAYQSAQNAADVGGGAMTDVLNDYNGQFRQRMEVLYGRRTIHQVSVAFGSSHTGTPNWDIGWHRAAELSTFPVSIYDVYDDDEIPDWFEVDTGATYPEQKGMIRLDSFDEGIFYHVQYNLWLEDMQNYSSLYLNKTWGLGLSMSQYANENPDRIITKTITQGDIDCNEATADFGNVAQWYLSYSVIGSFTELMPWIYVPLKPVGRRQCVASIQVTRLQA